MKRKVLLLTLGLMLALTGCHFDDAESSSSEIETAVTTPETSSAVSTATTTSSVSEVSSQLDEIPTPQAETTTTEMQNDASVVEPSAKDKVTTSTEESAPQAETTTTEMQNDASVVELSAKDKETTSTEESAPQLETRPEDEAVEEDTGDFGELFS